MFYFKNLIFIFFLILASTLGTQAIEYGGIGGRPAYPRKEEPKSDNVFIHNIKENQVINEGIKVVNNTNVTKTLMLYPADYIPSSDGGFACRQLLEKQIAVGTWIKLDKAEVTLEPMSSEIVDFTITTPSSLDAGEHNGCVLIQEKKNTEKIKSGINLSIRTGLRVLLTMPGNLIRKLELLSFKIQMNDKGNYYLIPEIRNTGNVSVESNVKVLTTNLFGMKHFEHGGKYSILKHDTARWNFELIHPFWGGIFKSKVTVSYNNGSKDIFLEKPSITFFVIPSIKALIIYALSIIPLLLLTLIKLFGFLTIKKARKTWTKLTVTTGDSLTSIAKKHQVSWRKLAKVNKIKAPYSLSSGDTLLVPLKKANDKRRNN